MDRICLSSIELWVVCGRLLWDRTSIKQWGCAWLFEKGRVRVQLGILALLKRCRSQNERMKKQANTHKKQTNGKKENREFIATQRCPSIKEAKEDSRKSLKLLVYYGKHPVDSK